MIRASANPFAALTASAAALLVVHSIPARAEVSKEFLQTYCFDCHDAETKKGGLDLMMLSSTPDKLSEAAVFAEWVKVHDRVRDGDMPPAKKPRADEKATAAFLAPLAKDLTVADTARQEKDGRSRLRRLTRVEFENSLRDLLCMPALKVKTMLPEDGKSHGFDKLSGALDISFVHVENYLSAVDKALNDALCPLPEAPPVFKYRYKPWDNVRKDGKECEGSIGLAIRDKTAIAMIGMKRDETFEAEKAHFIRDDEPKATAVGLFRHEDADYRTTMTHIQPYVSGWYKLRVSGYSFEWDGTQVVPSQKHGALSWGVYSRNENYGTVDLPPNQSATREITAWLERGGGMNHGTDDFLRIVGASLENVRDYAHGKNKDVIGPMWRVPGVAVEWVEIEGPLNEQWPPASHKVLFGDLPVKVWTKESRLPMPTQQIWARGNPGSEPKDIYGHRGEKRPIVYVDTKDPEGDAKRLLQGFLPRAFRRPVTDAEVTEYHTIVKGKLGAGAAFEDAMRAAYRQALVVPEFLLIREHAGKLSQEALATRLAYFLWGALPDEKLTTMAQAGKLADPGELRAQAERLLADAKGQRFVEDYLDQWLALRAIGATQPDRKLYPEFMPYLQEAMLMEARAFFGELLKHDLPVQHLVNSDFAMLNEPLARLYGIEGVRGWDIRKVDLPKGDVHGGFLTMAAVLKTTANGTTTSPVKRGAFVMEKVLGIVPTPPPPNVAGLEPDVRGTTTIREQLDKHRESATCAACHAKMDGYGFALEAFDVMGGWRDKYRAVGAPADGKDRKIMHGRTMEYHAGPAVDASGVMPDGRPFADVNELRRILAAQPEKLARAVVEHLVTYATGAELGFSDRAIVDQIVKESAKKGYGVKSLLLGVVGSELFLKK